MEAAMVEATVVESAMVEAAVCKTATLNRGTTDSSASRCRACETIAEIAAAAKPSRGETTAAKAAGMATTEATAAETTGVAAAEASTTETAVTTTFATMDHLRLHHRGPGPGLASVRQLRPPCKARSLSYATCHPS